MPKRKSNSNSQPKKSGDFLDAIDEARNCCANILTVAQLLEACDERVHSNSANVVSNAAAMILRDINKLRLLVNRLGKTRPGGF